MTAQEYLNKLPEERKIPLTQLQSAVKNTFPNIKETMLYKMPTYILGDNLICAFASQKNYMSLYIMPYDLLENFTEELKPFNCGKSCIRFKKMSEEDFSLFKKIIEYCGRNFDKSKFKDKMKVKR